MAPHGSRNAGHADTDASGSEEVPGANDSRWHVFKRAVVGWWYHHPAHVALDVARPLVGKYAQAHPVKLLGVAAAIGAAAVFLKPWRLISLGGVLLAALKSSDLKGMVFSVLTPGPHDTNNQRETQ